MLRFQLTLYRLIHKSEQHALDAIADVGDERSRRIACIVLGRPFDDPAPRDILTA